jgi:hypothetical protein
MKKGIILTLMVGGFFSFTIIGCGEKFTPLTDEQINAKVDSSFNAQKDAKMQELRSACDAKLDAESNAKLEELKNQETAKK